MKYYYRNNKLSLCNALYHARRQTDAWIRVWAAAFFFCSFFASNRFSAVIFPRILISSVDWNVEFKIIIGSSSISSPIGCRSHGAPFAGTLRRTFCFEMLLALLLLLLVGWLAWHSIAVCALPRYKKCAFILFSALHYYFVFFFLFVQHSAVECCAANACRVCAHARARLRSFTWLQYRERIFLLTRLSRQWLRPESVYSVVRDAEKQQQPSVQSKFWLIKSHAHTHFASAGAAPVGVWCCRKECSAVFVFDATEAKLVYNILK